MCNRDYREQLLMEGAVFEQKQSVLEGLNKLCYYTSMCGDGGVYFTD